MHVQHHVPDAREKYPRKHETERSRHQIITPLDINHCCEQIAYVLAPIDIIYEQIYGAVLGHQSWQWGRFALAPRHGGYGAAAAHRAGGLVANIDDYIVAVLFALEGGNEVVFGCGGCGCGCG